MLTPLCCSFGPQKDNLIGIDINKAYTSNLMDMEYFPSFNVFDTYQKYDGHELEDNTMYYVKALRENNSAAILFDKKYSRCFGYKLNRIPMTYFKVLYYKRPSNLIRTNAKEKVKELYDNEELSSTSKKQIINILLGLLEKKRNTRSKVQLFTNQEEAQYYIDQCGGVMGELSFYEDPENNENCLLVKLVHDALRIHVSITSTKSELAVVP